MCLSIFGLLFYHFDDAKMVKLRCNKCSIIGVVVWCVEIYWETVLILKGNLRVLIDKGHVWRRYQ